MSKAQLLIEIKAYGGDRLVHMLPAICTMMLCTATLEENMSMAVFPAAMQPRFEEWLC